MIKSTPHAHTILVDGKSSAEQMVLSAIERGFASLGFSEHAVQPFDLAYCLSPQTERMYRLQIEWLKQHYAPALRVYRGIERDSESTAQRDDYDYVIGSVHYLPLDGEMVAVDSTKEQVDRLVGEGFSGDGLRYAAAYYERLASYIESYKPDIIGHFDLIRKTNGAGRYFNKAGEGYLRIAMEAMERMAFPGALMEVNTGAMARGYLLRPYPDLPLLRRWKQLGGRVILSSDCHDAELIDFGFESALELARQAGFKEAWALNPGDGELFLPFSL